MNTNVSISAPVGYLALLGTSALIIITILSSMLYLLISRRLAVALAASAAVILIVVVYFALLLTAAKASSDRTLGPGQEKHFCEVDCHLAYSVLNVTNTKTIGRPPAQAPAAGVFYIVTIRTRFDETTISSHRGNSPLVPNSRIVTVVDQLGDSYEPSPTGQSALDRTIGSGTPLTTPLRPGESYTTEFVFDLPENVRAPVLWIRTGDTETRFIIGHENSFGHGRTFFSLTSAAARLENPWKNSM